MDRPLLTSQKNQIFDLIGKQGLNQSGFEWQEYDNFKNKENATVPILRYKGKNYYFVFGLYLNGKRNATYSPGKYDIVEESYTETWERQLSAVSTWLTYVKRETAQPDLWDQLSTYALPNGLDIDAHEKNVQFTYPEYQRILAGLDEIGTFLRKDESDSSAIDEINNTVEYLKEAAKRQGRRDWFFTCIGALMSVATSIAIDLEKSRGMWALLKAAVSGIVLMIKQ